MTGTRGPISDAPELKVLKGTATPADLAELERQEDEAELEAAKPKPRRAPAGMSAKGRAVWRRLVEEMGEDVLALRYTDGLVEYCEAVARAREARKDLADRGLLVTGQKGELVKNPSNQILREAVAVMVSLGDRFGLNPAKADLVNRREILPTPTEGEGATPPAPTPTPVHGIGRFTAAPAS